MNGINWKGVLAGGLVAGLVINVSEYLLNAVVLADEFTAEMTRLGIQQTQGTGTLIAWIVSGFVMGIAAVWLYAAIRPRFGAGVRTALCAGVMVWFLAVLFQSFGMVNLGLFPVRLMTMAAIWALIELGIATTLGAWVYKEGPA